MERRLATILAADAVAYSKLMGEDEEAALAKLTACRLLIDEQISGHGGRIFGSAGDSVVAEFASPVKAVQAALAAQKDIARANAESRRSGQLQFRIGVHLGDVLVQGDNLLGDGVNIAARLEALAPPGGVTISKSVAEMVLGKLDVEFGVSGAHKLKNISHSIELWIWPPEKAIRPAEQRDPKKLGLLAAAIALVLAGLVYLAYPNEETFALPTGPKVLILPFENVGRDPQDDYFSDGLTRDINAMLAKFTNLFILAPEVGTAFRDKQKCEAIRNELGADYILGGTVQRSVDKLRVTTTFTDAKTCLQLQAPGPFEGDLSLESVLDVQVEIARKIASLIGSSDAPLFKADVLQTIREKAPESLDAYECFMTAHWFYQTFALPEHRRARDCLLRTVAEEPGYSLGWSRLAYNYLDSKKNSFDLDPNWAQKSLDAAHHAIEADPDNPDAYYALAVRSRLLGESMDVYRTHAERAVALNPNDSWILADLGIFFAYSGDFETGLAWIERARALNPKLHPGYSYASHLDAIMRGDYDEAIDILLAMGGRLPMNMASLAASYALNGQQEKAEETVELIKQKFPNYQSDPRAPFRARGMPNELIHRIMEGLTLAGYPVPPKDAAE
ncbi:adenylate/guanylate cyclase domain-containing protein [Ruegeria arenilitoris]|uniref:adenylate/guanylate cyclase domain-containing protein n=1 Tax=Ruegeria arenilitoris TaxID=1173585 RepID=UPI00147F0A98|nr:adenylate/guanylate cyclase domain-containing protein [Ruegeria arenilitoris]